MDAADVLAGRYRLVERLGEGGMSVVWRAHDEVLDRQVAVKLLSPRLLADQDSRLRIRAEAQAVAKLAHPNVAGVFDFGEHTDGVPYIVMELLNGQTLAERLEDGQPPIAEVLRICSQVALALGAAHEFGIVHRDVKPANVMVLSNGTTKVVDFGVAALVGDLTDRDAVLFGTPAYVAPERLSGGAVVAATDVYGLGVLLYRMLTGNMPWSADSTTQMLVAHMYVEPDPLPPLTGLPPEVVEVCQACLAKEPEDRPAAAEVAEVLAASAAAIDGGAGARPARAAKPARNRTWPTAADAAKRRRRRRIFAAAGVAGALVSVITAAVVAAAVVGPDDPADGAGANGNGQGRQAQPAVSVGVGGASGSSSASPPSGRPGSTHTDGPGAGPGQPGESQPGTTPTTPPPTTAGPTTAGSEPRRATQSNNGNTVTVECVGEVATIVSAVPGEGYLVNRINRGPAEQVNVRFESSTVEPPLITFRGRCNDGVPKMNFSNA